MRYYSRSRPPRWGLEVVRGQRWSVAGGLDVALTLEAVRTGPESETGQGLKTTYTTSSRIGRVRKKDVVARRENPPLPPDSTAGVWQVV